MHLPLCLLPGILCDEFVWEPQRAFFEADRTVVIPKLTGFASLSDMAQSVLDQISGQFALAGHSMGGRVALEILRLAPERVGQLALLDTGTHGVRPDEKAVRAELIAQSYEEGMEAVARRFIVPMLHPSRLDEEALVTGLIDMVCRATPEDFEGQMQAMLGRRDATELLPQISCPTMVICGREDSWSPWARHKEMAARIPGAQFQTVEDCGHMTTIERPSAVNAALAAWLAIALAAAG